MAEALLLQFEGVGKAQYDAVNDKLGIDMDAGSGDWPRGLLMHSAGLGSTGALVVAEVWASRADQEAFMHERLGQALGSAGVTSAPSVTWLPLFTFHALAG